MNSRFKFPRRVRIHGGECGAVARALHHEARSSLPAVTEKVSFTTFERNQMSIKANFKRISLAVVVTLSLGMLGTAPSSAGTIIGETMTVAGSSSAASSSITQGETATVSVVNTFTPEDVRDSIVVMTSCAAPAGASCYNLLDFFWTETTDSTSNAIGGVFDGSGTSFVQNTDDSFTIGSSVAGQAVRFTSNLKFRATAATTAGVYTVTVYTKRSSNGGSAAVNSASPSITWTVTVASQATAITGLNLYVSSSLAQSGYWHRTFATSKDSAVVASNGVNYLTGLVSYDAAAYINFNPKNSLGETTTAAGTVLTVSSGDVRATVTGPGVITLGSSVTGSTGVKTLTTLTADNNGATGAATETLTVYSDGTSGVSTVTFTNVATGAVIGTASITFTGAAASATSVSLSDTSVAKAGTPTISAVLKDSAGNVLGALPTGQAIYVFASDTRVVSGGANSTDAAQMTQFAAGARNASAVACSAGAFSGGRYSCGLTIGDTGTATITLRDSWTVAASSWTSDALTVTGLGTERAALTVAFDKATYVAGELAVITITSKDRAGRASAGTSAYTEITSSMSLGSRLSTSTSGGTATAVDLTASNYTPFGVESGVETRVVYMPATSGTVNFSVKYTPDVAAAGSVATTVTASATVSNPAEDAAKAAEAAAAKAGTDAVAAAKAAQDAAVAAANAAQAAAEKAATDAVAAAKAAQDAAVAEAKKTAEAAVAAADAAADAAAEAIDAANAATDAANLSAEAADAATVAAEEARDAADAATAAVEELATQVATLMAALKAQITTLANTVAKIAKKVKA